jgi:hypothetical protein
VIGNSRLGPPPVFADTDDPKRLFRPDLLVVAAGLVCLLAAEFVLAWAVSEGNSIVDGRNEPDGLVSLFLALLVPILLKSALDSDTLTVQLAPALLGIAIAATVADGYFLTTRMVAGWDRPAELASGIYVEMIGGLLVAAIGLVTSIRALAASASRRSAGARRSERASPYLTSSQFDGETGVRVVLDLVLLMLVGAAGVALGWLAAVWIAGLLGQGPFYASRLASLALLGILLGPAVTVSTWRRITRRGSEK